MNTASLGDFFPHFSVRKVRFFTVEQYWKCYISLGQQFLVGQGVDNYEQETVDGLGCFYFLTIAERKLMAMFPFFLGTGCETPRCCLVSFCWIEGEVQCGVSATITGIRSSLIREHTTVCVVMFILQMEVRILNIYVCELSIRQLYY